MTVPDPAPAGPRAAAGDDAGCWQEAARLRREHPGWIVIWLAPIRQYKAYRRLPGARRDTALAARTPGDLAAQITQAEQARRTPPPRRPAPATRKDQP
jgi:hypothetical protein